MNIFLENRHGRLPGHSPNPQVREDIALTPGIRHHAMKFTVGIHPASATGALGVRGEREREHLCEQTWRGG